MRTSVPRKRIVERGKASETRRRLDLRASNETIEIEESARPVAVAQRIERERFDGQRPRVTGRQREA